MARVGIIGRGWGERAQAPNFRDAGLEIAGIAGHDGWQKILGGNAEVVTIVTPPSTHLEIATAALEAGKHVICEKPTAMDADQGQKLVAAAAAHPKQIAIIDHELRFLPSFRAARERIGEIGAVRYAEVRYASPSRGDRSRPWNWWSDASQGGGVWGAVGSHYVDALRFLGMEIESVQALLSTIIGERSGKKVTADDFASVHLRLHGGAVAAMTFSAVASGPDEPTALTIHGENGSFRLTGEALLFAPPRGAFSRIAGDDLQQRPGNSPGGAFGTGTYRLGLALERALDEGDRGALAPAATFADGLIQQKVLDAARRSQREGGRWVEVADS
ncbi:MAG TPA: Gfo/Idh/MocA family oxidoreductase [Thermoanaerobaculia bacterium]|nr:Gfo/Idh/MocA family oxidoreductase [Thermoanaerobaculia bacterium]